MSHPVSISLPIADRRTSHAFYRDGLDLVAVGDLADDGLPEPLQFVLGEGVSLMLVPIGGFGWVLGERPVAPADTSECILGMGEADPDAVDATVARATSAGGTIVSSAQEHPWGYAATFADPDGHLWMVTADATA